MKPLGRVGEAARFAYDTGRIVAGLTRYVVTGECCDPEGRVLRGELE